MLQLYFFQKCKVQLFQIGLNQKHFKYTRVIHQKIGGSVPCVIIMAARNFRKMLSILIHLDIQTLFPQQVLV